MARRHLILSLILLLTLAARTQAKAYPVTFALPLDKLAEQSDLIVKVQAVSSEEVKDTAFPDYTAAGFAVFSTKLKVISVLKGDAKLAEISFHHYDDAPKAVFVESHAADVSLCARPMLHSICQKIG